MENAAESSPFPPDLVLSPLSRRPLKLPDETIRAVLSKPIPSAPPASRSASLDDSPLVSIVVLTFNNLVFARLCLESLLAHTDYPNYELIVVDNGSLDGTPAYLEALAAGHPHMRLLLNDHNRGVAAGNNQGLSLGTGAVLVLVNDDTIPPPGWLPRLVRHVADPTVGMVGPVTNRIPSAARIDADYRTYREFLDFAAKRARQHDASLLHIDVLNTFFAAMRRETFARVGPFDERYEVGLLEDDDYMMRLRLSGYRVACAEDVFVHHFGEASFGKLFSSGKYGELLRANKQRYEEKWGTPWQPYRQRENPEYEELIERVRATVRERVPVSATVIVVSRGDHELLELDGRVAWHFPQAADAAYAGHYPKDSTEAIDHLEDLRAKGADFLLIPRTAFWWLDHYQGFTRHLREQYDLVVEQDDACVIFSLRRLSRSRSRDTPQAMKNARTEV